MCKYLTVRAIINVVIFAKKIIDCSVSLFVTGMQFNALYVSGRSRGNPHSDEPVALRRVKSVYRRAFESSNLIIPITKLEIMETVGQGRYR